MAQAFDYDLAVIGGGSGGVRCARIAARLGAKVLCVEKRFWGGTCVNVGCVPKKLYVMGSEFSGHFSLAESFGWSTYGGGLRWEQLKSAKDAEISRLSGIYDNLLKNSGVDRRWGEARLVDGNTVQVQAQHYRCKYIVIATGSQAVLPAFPGAEHVLISDDFFEMKALPKTAVVIGGGYIAVELAGILNAAGTQTTLLYRGDCLLRGFDRDVREHVQACLRLRGVDVHLNSVTNTIAADDHRYIVTSVAEEKTCAEKVFAATGRTPNTHGLCLEEVGIALDKQGAIPVDEHYRTVLPSVYAVGDVISRKQLTPVALAEGMYVANTLFGGKPQPVNYDTIATAVFSQPPIGTVGLSEDQCMTRHRPFRVYKSYFKPMSHAFSTTQEKVFVKILVDDESDQVLGIHMVGEHAGEIIQGFAAAMTCGVTKQQLDNTLGIHPTVAEEIVTLREATALITP